MHNREKPVEKIVASCPWRVLLSVLVFIGALFWLVPYLLRRIHNGVVAGLLILLLVPLVRAITEHLLNEAPAEASLQAFARTYLVTLYALVFELALLALALPVILIHLASVLTGMMLVVLLIGVIIAVLQLYLGVQIGRPLTPTDLQETLRWFGYALVAEVSFIAVIKLANRYKHTFFEHTANFFKWMAGREG